MVWWGVLADLGIYLTVESVSVNSAFRREEQIRYDGTGGQLDTGCVARYDAPTMTTRCQWAGSDPLYVAYHDQEWGVPVRDDDRLLFEFLILEGAQAGLSWSTILNKRESYRATFDNFDPQTVAAYDDEKIAELLRNSGIVRNRLKVNAAVKNARAFLAVQSEFGSFSTYIWQFVGGQPRQNAWRSLSEIPAETDEFARDEQESEAPRLHLRRPDHLLRVHAGGRNSERSHRGLFSLRTVRINHALLLELVLVLLLVCDGIEYEYE